MTTSDRDRDSDSEREQRQSEWRNSLLHGPGGMPFDPRSVYPSYPSRLSYREDSDDHQ